MRSTAMRKARYITIMCILIISIIYLGINMMNDRQYRTISIVVAFLSCLPFYVQYEHRKPQAREVVIIAIMCAIAIASRMLFAFLPGFKPMSAIIILTGMAFGKEAGFLCGSMSALLSNMFFGQGPWTPFQMLTWGLIGLFAGIFYTRGWLHKRSGLLLYGIFAGIFFSVVMDIWSVLSFDGSFLLSRYVALLVTSLPFMLIYAVSNCVFLWMLEEPFMKKLMRIKVKYGMGDERYEICDKL